MTGRNFIALPLIFNASSVFLASISRMIKTDEARLYRNRAYTPIIILSAKVKYPVVGIPLSIDRWKVVAARSVVTAKLMRMVKFWGAMNNVNREIAVITDRGRTLLMKAETSGLAIVTLKVKRENV